MLRRQINPQKLLWAFAGDEIELEANDAKSVCTIPKKGNKEWIWGEPEAEPAWRLKADDDINNGWRDSHYGQTTFGSSEVAVASVRGDLAAFDARVPGM